MANDTLLDYDELGLFEREAEMLPRGSTPIRELQEEEIDHALELSAIEVSEGPWVCHDPEEETVGAEQLDAQLERGELREVDVWLPEEEGEEDSWAHSSLCFLVAKFANDL